MKCPPSLVRACWVFSWLLLSGCHRAPADHPEPPIARLSARPELPAVPGPASAEVAPLLPEPVATEGEGGSPADASNPPAAEAYLRLELVPALVREFYESRGEFHGQYLLESVQTLRPERTGARSYAVHVHYVFRCGIAACCCGDSGEDKRIFLLEWREQGWEVTAMTGYMTASP